MVEISRFLIALFVALHGNIVLGFIDRCAARRLIDARNRAALAKELAAGAFGIGVDHDFLGGARDDAGATRQTDSSKSDGRSRLNFEFHVRLPSPM